MNSLKRELTKSGIVGLAVLYLAHLGLKWSARTVFGFQADGNELQKVWDRFLQTFGDDPYTLYVVWTSVFIGIAYATVGGVFTLMDITNLPQSLRKYKVQPGTNEPIDPDRLRDLIRTNLVNMFFVSFPFTMVMYRVNEWRGLADIKTLPDFWTVIGHVVFCTLVEEAAFFYSHWALHSKYLYKHIHKKHHEWQASVAYTSIYAHPFEHLVSNLVGPFLGPLILKAHITTAWLWFFLAISVTVNSHSGYHLPFMPSPEAHDFHHLKFNQCFGVLGFFDWLHGTDKVFRSNEAFNRHITSFSLTPVREIFPDGTAKKTK